MQSKPLVVRQLSVGFKKPLFKNLDLTIDAGEFVTIMGSNGCGKTVFLESLMGIHPYKGEIEFWGQSRNECSRSKINKKVAWVVSRNEDFPPLIKVGSYIQWISQAYPNWSEELAENLIEKFSLDRQKRVSHLSLGESSKLRLLVGLSARPELLILDELTANLDEESKKVARQTLIESLSERKMSVVYISHSQEEAMRLSDRILKFTDRGLEEVQ